MNAAQVMFERDSRLFERVVNRYREMENILETRHELQRLVAEEFTFPDSALQQLVQVIIASPGMAFLDDLACAAAITQDALDQYEPDRQQVALLMGDVLAALGSMPDLSGLSKLPRLFYPPNWGPLPADRNAVVTAVSIMSDEGIPLAWVPRPDIVTELVNAHDATARSIILTRRTSEIAVDCHEALDQVTNPDLKSLVDLARRALAALETTPEAAQALAANIFETFLREANRRGQMFGSSFGYFQAQKVTKRITPVRDVTSAADLRIACVLTPALLALAEFHPGTDPIPPTFNRHATAHTADLTQYTQHNAVIAVILMTSFLRQAKESGW